ncbi:MAG TPA: hypothetical protein VE843_07225 [Ktedonobacteraceae bacterium]|nr:hypothetical protein [Ktedonobacteraceae bacterium]
MTLPTPDAQSSRFLSQQTHSIHSIPTNHSIPATPVPSSLSSTSLNPPETENSSTIARERATDFATHSWDLATGGLKTLTAKRELPPRLGRRSTNQLSDAPVTPRSYMFPLVILACIVIMLISGGIVLFMLVQP